MAITLKAARVNAGFRQRDVCDRLRIAQSTLCSWEKGRTYPTIPQFKELCKLYGCGMGDIYGEAIDAGMEVPEREARR